METKEVIQEVVRYFKSDQWQELMRMLMQNDEELYHVHLYWENQLDAYSLCNLFEKYFKLKGMALDRKIDLTTVPAPGMAGLHSVHPHNPKRSLYIPAIDMWWRFNPNVVLEPADPSNGEEGKNIIGWGKSHMDSFYKKFHFKTVGPKEEREIRNYFESAHWKKFLRMVDSGLYTHIHANLEINFDPWILKMFTIEALSKIGWKMDHAIPCVFHGVDGKEQGKIVFLTAYPEEVWDIAWDYKPNVVIRPAEKEFVGYLPEDGDIAFDAFTKSRLEETLAEEKYLSLTHEQVEDILKQL
jgi:hypothetical protein